MTACRVGLVLVAHSARLAEGLVEVAGQMAPEVPIRPAGGCPDGRVGTSYDRVEAAIAELLAESVDVVVLTDLGSATLMAEAVLEGLDDDRVSFVDAPLVEGAVHAAVAAQTGGDAAAVRRAALRVGASYAGSAETQLAAAAAARAGAALAARGVRGAGRGRGGRPVRAGAGGRPNGTGTRHGAGNGTGDAAGNGDAGRPAESASGGNGHGNGTRGVNAADDAPRPAPAAGSTDARSAQRHPGAPTAPRAGAAGVARTVTLTNRLGLHARPAAYLARTAGAFDAVVSVNGVPATSVLDVMELGLLEGAAIRIAASGAEADEALDAVEELVASRFGEE